MAASCRAAQDSDHGVDRSGMRRLCRLRYELIRASEDNIVLAQADARLCRSICGKATLFRVRPNPSSGYAAVHHSMFQISKDNPAYYLTSVAHNRLPVFQMDKIKQIVCDAFDEARKSGGIMIFAYAIMPDHTHLLTDNKKIKWRAA